MIQRGEASGLICLGASAGGLRSLEAIVSRLRADLPWPVLICQHLQHDRVSEMPAILGRIAALPVREAVDGEIPRAGTIYTCPSSHEMGLTFDGAFALRAPVAGRPQRIDHLFSSASATCPGRTIAVVLSGTGSDGALGSLVVKLAGGVVITESDASAQHGAMPAAAQRAGTVDATLGADAIAQLLHDLARGGLDEANAATRKVLRDIAAALTALTGTDFAHYREGTLRRQVEKRRAILGLSTLTAYASRVSGDASERDALVRSLLIPVTEFFRDPAAWRAIEETVVPLLAQRARNGRPVRVWCVGCATGEEAYAMAILLAEALPEQSNIQILATDLHADAIEVATQGAYDATRTESLGAERRERFFVATEQGFRAKEDLRRMVQFRVHDVTREPAPGRFDVIVCRNLLIYFDDELQAKTLTIFREALAGAGILFLGRSEAIPGHNDQFMPLARPLRIFRAAGPGPVDEDELPFVEAVPQRDAEGTLWSGTSDVRVEAPDALVLVVDDSWRITRANGRARALLDADLVGTNLLDLFPRWQGSPVHDALRTSLATGRSLKVRGVPAPGGPLDVTLERSLDGDRGTLIIGTPALAHRAHEETHEVHADLAATNDELQSANEELAATNEELQATNEELASLNEEFQSTNQTLASTNVELGAVAENARAATDLMAEFLQTWREAIVACDMTQRITTYNRRAADLFGLDPSCVGRPIAAALGAHGRGVDAWLANARTGNVTQAIDHESGKLEVSVEHVRSATGAPLGWVLSWAAPR